MITHFISTEINLAENTAQLQKSVEAELHKYGKPLRWAITAVDSEKGKVILEAVVTK
ncbi:hypothetical protein [Rivularia sp. UHCC 0363]|uniref:hypothetical protein n=1 Tax=Rivularia sp. UHCC 0363 TaxID=3110244 RepID=UPI002B1F1A7E|nr:hypothetical protein [Rivularia sp. UHCC 0363]MEA5596655.1 hypothetical protein [Rivularia sp. UHCC 0363]